MVLAEMNLIIERSASEYRHSRVLSAVEIPMHKHNSSSACDTTDISSEFSEVNNNPANNMSHHKVLSNSSIPFDESETSSINSRMIGGSNKIGATIVGLYGAAGTGK